MTTAAEILQRFREKRKVRLTVEANLDPVPGWGDNPDDWQALVQRLLDDSVGHYHPSVTVAAGPTLLEAADQADRLANLAVTSSRDVDRDALDWWNAEPQAALRRGLTRDHNFATQARAVATWLRSLAGEVEP